MYIFIYLTFKTILAKFTFCSISCVDALDKHCQGDNWSGKMGGNFWGRKVGIYLTARAVHSWGGDAGGNFWSRKVGRSLTARDRGAGEETRGLQGASGNGGRDCWSRGFRECHLEVEQRSQFRTRWKCQRSPRQFRGEVRQGVRWVGCEAIDGVGTSVEETLNAFEFEATLESSGLKEEKELKEALKQIENENELITSRWIL